MSEADKSGSENFNDTDNVYFSRVVVIFVFTELFLRATFASTSVTFSYPSNETFNSLKELESWWRDIDVVKTLLDFRVWRIAQLCLLVVVYVYKLCFRDDDDDIGS